MNNDDKLKCRICGYLQNEAPWDEYDCPTHNICECCGCEFGYQDGTLNAIKINRKKWLDDGAKWRWPEHQPPNWNLAEQLNQIPEEFK